MESPHSEETERFKQLHSTPGFDAYYTNVYSRLVRQAEVTANINDAEDLAQEAIIRVWRARPPEDLKGPATYTRKVLTNLIISKSRLVWPKYEELRDALPEQGVSEDFAERAYESWLIDKAFASLSGNDLILARMRFIDDADLDTCAARFGYTRATVKTYIHRLQLRLRAEPYLRELLMGGHPEAA